MSNGTRVVKCPGCERSSRVPDVALGRPQCGACQRFLPWLIDANDATFDEAVFADMAVLVELWATWSKPSALVSPIVERIAGDYAGRLKVVRIDADRTPRVQARHKLKGAPALLIMRDGKALEAIYGAQPAVTVRRHLDGHLLMRV